MKKRTISAIVFVILLSIFVIGKAPFEKKRKPCFATVVQTTTTSYSKLAENTSFALRMQTSSTTNNANPTENSCRFATSAQASTTTASFSSGDIYDMLTPELIQFYESYIAKEKIVTGIKAQKLARLTQTYNVSKNKMFAMIIVQDVASKNKQKISLTALSEKGDGELLAYGKEQVTIYIEGLPEEEKQLLAEKFAQLKKTYRLPTM